MPPTDYPIGEEFPRINTRLRWSFQSMFTCWKFLPLSREIRVKQVPVERITKKKINGQKVPGHILMSHKLLLSPVYSISMNPVKILSANTFNQAEQSPPNHPSPLRVGASPPTATHRHPATSSSNYIDKEPTICALICWSH